MENDSCIMIEWFGLWCLVPLSIICQLYHGGRSYWWWKMEYLQKSTDVVENGVPAEKYRCTVSH